MSVIPQLYLSLLAPFNVALKKRESGSILPSPNHSLLVNIKRDATVGHWNMQTGLWKTGIGSSGLMKAALKLVEIRVLAGYSGGRTKGIILIA
jgi:hypothetical protein